MMDGLRNYWSGLSAREQKLVALAALLALGMIAWLLVRPAMALGLDMARTHQVAVERAGRVSAKAALLRGPAPGSRAGTGNGLDEQFLAQSASEIGLSLSRNERRGNSVNLAIAGGKAPVVVAWIAGLEGQGFIIDALTITPQVDGTVGLTADVHMARAVRP